MARAGENKSSIVVTDKQKRVAEEVIKNQKRKRPLNKGEILAKVGYAKSIHKSQPKRIFSSAGVQQALINAGAGPDRLATVVNDAMRAKQGSWFRGEYNQSDAPDHKIRLSAASLLGDLTGTKKMVVEGHNINVDMSSNDIAGALGL